MRLAPTAPDARSGPIRPWDRARWRSWVARTTLGETVGFLFPVLVVLSGADDLAAVPRLAVLLLAGAAEGAVLGWAQSSVLAQVVPELSRRDWIVRTALAAVVAWAVGLGPSTWAAGAADLPASLLVVLAVPVAVVLLSSIGFAQWTVLRRHVPAAGRWIGWTAAAWLAGLGVFTAVTTPLWQPGQEAVTVALIGVLGGLLMAAAMAVVTAAGMGRLLSPRDR
ncbi:hypothetical protein [Blastococcus litoris]|uniref:hypothetical protein n=1 Tax=Blastococcus litoris TaxID=2171622 RepID=UPI0019D17615|nr:hypothetical protein [Blastococcus litoris]